MSSRLSLRLGHLGRTGLTALGLLAASLSMARCSCEEVLGGLPEPKLEVLNDTDESHLTADPWLLVQFGDLDSGGVLVEDVRLKNIGTGTLQVSSVCLVQATDLPTALAATCATGAAPFSFADATGPIEPGAERIVPITFAPTTGGPQNYFVRVNSDSEGEPVAAFEIAGRGTDGRLCASEGVVDFGDVPLGTTATRQVTVSNCGVKPVSLDNLGLGDNPDGAFAFTLNGAAPVLPIGPLAENEDIILDVTFTPTQPGAYAGARAGSIVATTAAPFVAQYAISLIGNAVVPPTCQVNIIPSTVNFGAVASGATATRQMVVQSVGQCACTVEGIDGPTPAGSAFTLGTLPAFPVVLRGTVGCEGDAPDAAAAPSALTVDVNYLSPVRDVPLADTATLTVRSSDADTPSIDVPLQANGGGQPFCELEVTPEGASGLIPPAGRFGELEFGRVSVFIEKRLPIQLKNIGNIDCNVTDVEYHREENTLNNEFTVETEAGAPAVGSAPVVIQPGQTATYFAVFAPTRTIDNGGLFNFGTYSGAYINDALCGFVSPNARCNGVRFVTDDLRTDVGDEDPGVFSIGFSGTPVEPAVDVIPGQLDFGLVTVGCGSPQQRVTVYNTGGAPLVVGQPRIEPVGTTFVIEGTNPAGPFPLSIPPGGQLAILVRYNPPDTALHTASIFIPTVEGAQDGPPVTIPVQGEGTLEIFQRDVFDQFSDPKVDVLWVVDDSGSMSPVQTLLAQNFGQFFTASNVAAADYHIAVTTTLTADSSCIALPQTCSTSADCGVGGTCFLGLCEGGSGGNTCADDPMSGHYTACDNNDRYLSTSSTNPSQQFVCNVQVSTPGNVNPSRSASDSAEGGLRAAFNFLSEPKISDPAINGGFLRDDAKLHIIMVSDEPEQSRGGIDLYLDFFRNVKGFRNESLVAVSAIATDPGGCTFQGTAIPDPGTRYADVVNEMNGRFQSLCAQDWSTTMGNLGLDSLGLRVEFLLSRAAEASTIQVCVRSTPAAACTPVARTSDGAPNGWFYDATANSVVFNNPEVNAPRGSRVEVSYNTFCF